MDKIDNLPDVYFGPPVVEPEEENEVWEDDEDEDDWLDDEDDEEISEETLQLLGLKFSDLKDE